MLSKTSSTPPAFERLNYDILRNIVSCLWKKDLIALARCSRAFASLAQEELYNNLNIRWTEYPGGNNLKFEQLTRTFDKNPQLKDFVRHIIVSVYLTKTREWTTVDQIQTMILQMSNIQSITWPSEGVQENFLANLLTKSSYLKRLKLERYGGMTNLPISTLLENIADKKINLQELTIGPKLYCEEFSRLMHALPCLSKLTCLFPGVSDLVNRHSAAYPLLTMNTANVFGVTTSTLTELVLFGGDDWSTHGETRLDFSIFTRLKILDVPNLLLFDSPSPSPRRNGVFRLLPSTLQSFSVSN